jgi:hypothetical protein
MMRRRGSVPIAENISANRTTSGSFFDFAINPNPHGEQHRLFHGSIIAETYPNVKIPSKKEEKSFLFSLD